MPALAALIFGLQLLCLAHVMRTGRPGQWVFIIMGLPLAGCVAYLVMEILPDLRHSQAARQTVRDIGAVIDPERDLREKAQKVADADTVENRAALAEECLRRGRAADARQLFESCLTGVHAADHALSWVWRGPSSLPAIMRARARRSNACAPPIPISPVRTGTCCTRAARSSKARSRRR
jgi:hypothetical protein